MKPGIIVIKRGRNKKLQSLTFLTRYQSPMTDEMATQIKSTLSNLKFKWSMTKKSKAENNTNKLHILKVFWNT